MSIFISDHSLAISSAWRCAAIDWTFGLARKLHINPQILNGRNKRPANRPAMLRCMGKVITVRFRRSILPRRLLDDGWWLESKPARPVVVAFPKHRPVAPTRRRRHLTLVKPEK
jgi:hypothetical protein